MMEINSRVREEIMSMMLHIEDIEHYDQIDWLRENEYGRKYAREHGYKAKYLPSRLLSDQSLVNDLQKATQEHPEQMEKVYKDTAQVMEDIKALNIRDWLFRRKPGVGAAMLRGLGLLILLPIFIVSIIPTALLFIIPEIFLKKMIKDQMFISTFRVAVSALVSIPLCMFVPAGVLWGTLGIWWALAYLVAFPFMFLIAWNYMRLFMKFLGTCRFVANRRKVKEIHKLRLSVFNRLDALLK